MDRLDKLSSYFNERERKKLNEKTKATRNGLPEMSVDEIKLSCLENNGYETPELNDKLYLHFRGFKKIENLDRYTGCKAIWLDSNGLNKIENLDGMVQLRCLYLSKNLISNIEGLCNLKELIQLDLSNNHITHVQGLDCCPNLQIVNLSRNALASAESIAHFSQCESICNIDMTNNRLPAEEDILTQLSNMSSSIVTLSLNGNEVTKLPSYRKRLITLMPKLGYLDRPVDVQERKAAEAFVRGGVEAETQAREEWKEEQRMKRINEMEAFKSWQAEHQRLRQQALSEGRSLITEMTPAEIAARRLEAEKAAEDEKEALEGGVGKLAHKYWQLEGENSSSSSSSSASSSVSVSSTRSRYTSDPLDRAMRQINEEKRRLQVDGPELVEIVGDDDVEVEEKENVKEILPAVVEKKVEEKKKSPPSSPVALPTPPVVAAASPTPVASVSTKMNIIEEEQQTVFPPLPPSSPSPSQSAEQSSSPLSPSSPVVAPDLESRTLTRQEQIAEERLRQQRVAESMAIYKRQREEEKIALAKKNGTYDEEEDKNRSSRYGSTTNATAITTAASTSTSTSTWDVSKTNIQLPRTLYWSEGMDMLLARLVRECVFDFDLIARKLVEAVESGSVEGFDVNGRERDISSITCDACRVRWSQLDASQWSQLEPSSSALDTVFKVCIAPSILGSGHGAQPTFQALASMTSNGMPSYLTPPSQFPSVSDLEEEGEDNDDDVYTPVRLRGVDSGIEEEKVSSVDLRAVD